MSRRLARRYRRYGLGRAGQPGSTASRGRCRCFVAVVFIGFWDLLTRSGLVSPIILPTPAETLTDLIFVGRNLLSGGYMLALSGSR
jgi:ABC-type nitrate/sulfonate/bicarbonate transport system permease component